MANHDEKCSIYLEPDADGAPDCNCGPSFCYSCNGVRYGSMRCMWCGAWPDASDVEDDTEGSGRLTLESFRRTLIAMKAALAAEAADK